MPNRVKKKDYHANSKRGVNFQVTLKQIRIKRNHIKHDLPVIETK